MLEEKKSTISRRAFVRRTGVLAGGVLLGTQPAAAPAAAPADQPAAPAPSAGDWPCRVLGRTGVPVTTMTLGTAPAGICKKIPPPQVAEVVNAALDQGITSIDTAPLYNQAEEGVGLALGSRRKEVFLATKVWADTIEKAEESLSESFRLLKTDYVDLLYYHSIGNRKLEGARGPQGVFTWLVKQKKAGKCRFLGISGHNLPGRFPEFIETGEVDVMMSAINFVDRHTYNFVDKVLPVARKHNVGVIAMKVFGGANKEAGSYNNPKCPPQLDLEHLELAVRYSLSVPGVATVNLGVHNKQQVLKNVEMVKRFKPLSSEEQDTVARLGKQLAQKWGPHFGPVS